MKKVRKIKIEVTTREILITRNQAQEKTIELNKFSVCPMCNSQLAQRMEISIDPANPTENKEKLK